jgi:ubiquinone/menaquinone biosynthesis C-methylase UbiE
MTTQSATQSGSVEQFDRNWKNRKETKYNHWTRGEPANQIQLAFRMHWNLFRELIGERTGKCLEIGAGRGSISSYFADAGFDCTLVDTSPTIVKVAEEIFERNGHKGRFLVGDAEKLEFADEEFDVTVSIGLIEHFADPTKMIAEQLRVLKPGGIFLGYIVPAKRSVPQLAATPLNLALKAGHRLVAKAKPQTEAAKEEVFRTDYDAKYYEAVASKLGAKKVSCFGVYPLPMVSHSPDFPFSLMPPPAEKLLVGTFDRILKLRQRTFGQNPWICSEKFSQSILLVFEK